MMCIIKVMKSTSALALILGCMLASCASGSQDTTENGVSFSLVLDKPELTLHEPVFALLTVENTRNEKVSFDLGPNRKANIRLVVAEPGGTTASPPGLVPEGTAGLGGILLEPGAVFRQNVLVNEWYQFSKTGRYEIRLKLVDLALKTESGTVLSNQVSFPPIRIQLDPRNEGALIEACQKLADGALHDPDYEKRREDAVALSFVPDLAAVPYLVELANDRLCGWVAVLGLARIAHVEGIEPVVSKFGKTDAKLEASVRAAQSNLEGRTHVLD